MSIPPIIINGQPTCPDGYVYDFVDNVCRPITPPISVDVNDVSAQEIDPAIFARLQARGLVDSGLVERFVAALWTAPLNMLGSIIKWPLSVFDIVLAGLAQVFLGAQAQRTQGFYTLAAALMTDLMGIEVDATKLYNDFQSKGRLSAMQDLGASLFNALASEFSLEEQVTTGNSFKITPGAGVGGLPDKMPGPGDGVKAAQAFIGFVTSFAVREGNTDLIADFPIINRFGVFNWFKDFGEDFSKSLGIGRLLRVAIRPLMQIMVAEPLTHDLNTQYRPTFFKPAEAIRAMTSGFMSPEEMNAELAAAGYSDKRITMLQWQHDKLPSVQELETLRAARDPLAQDEAVWLHRAGYTDEVIGVMQRARDLEPARRLSLRYLEHYLEQYLQGHLTQASVLSFIDGIAASGKVLVTPGELDAVRALVTLTSTATLRPRHLSFAQLQLAYIDGTITLQELEDHLTQVGYSQSDVTTLGLETLIKAKDKAAAAAKKAATGKTGTPTPGSAATPTPTTGA